MRRSYVYELVMAAMFAVIIAICAWITVPFAVPFTMQTFGVFLAIAVLGGKWGTVSVLIYILLGAVGIPVFSGFQGGFGVLFGNTGGYILGFLVSAFLIWGMELLIGRKTWAVLAQMFVGLLACYGFGTLCFWFLYTQNAGAVSIGAVLTVCVVPFVVPDVVKILLAWAVWKRLCKVIRYVK